MLAVFLISLDNNGAVLSIFKKNNWTGEENVYIYGPIRFEHSMLLHHHAIRLHYGIRPLLWRMKKPCVGLWLPVFVCVCVCACSHYLLLPAPGESAPSLHLSSWLATICLSTSSSLVSRSNWSSFKKMGLMFRNTFWSDRALCTSIDRWGWQFDSWCRPFFHCDTWVDDDTK